MKLLFTTLLILFSCTFFSAQTNESFIDSGNAAYAKNKFEAAAAFYSQVLSKGFESAELYYNIGNSYYKNNQPALAILYYEKAKKISPSDEDINFNLKLVEAKLVDKIEPIPSLFFNDWWSNFLIMCSEKTWSIIFIFLVWIGFTGLLAYFLLKNRTGRKTGFIISVFAFLLSFIFFAVAYKSNAITSTHSKGIILSSTVNIKGSPSEQGTNLFVLHEGTKVSIEQNDGEWTEIKISNGNRGWIKKAELGVI